MHNNSVETYQSVHRGRINSQFVHATSQDVVNSDDIPEWEIANQDKTTHKDMDDGARSA